MATTKDSGEITTEELRAKAKELHIRFTKSTSDDVLLEKIEEAEKLLAPKIKKQFTNKNRMALVHVQVNSLDPYIQKQPHVFRQISNEVVSLIDHLCEEYAIDEERIYATGFSMGGIKSWDLFQQCPE